MRTWKILMAAAVLFAGSDVRAQNLGPGEPDQVMECFRNNVKAPACTFACGSSLSWQNPAANTLTWSNVSRVEFFNKQNNGRGDGRSWVFVAYNQTTSALVSVSYLYIGQDEYCRGELNSGIANPGIELRFTKFNFD